MSRIATVVLCGLILTACASAPEPRREVAPSPAGEQISVGAEIALRAIAQVGRPYRYGGADLNGFDCSGLVFYIHRELGLTVPRTAAEQFIASDPVDIRRLEPGDLVFFRTTRRQEVSHVGIYAGEGRFVHAPQSGRLIELHALGDDYYGSRFVGAGRIAKN
jgi:cell wall-associated NlpC family hydrolase